MQTLPGYRFEQRFRGFKYPPYGKCIYCGAVATPATRLSDEHLVARSLGGVSVLPEASCIDCAKVTSYLEGYCANNMFDTLRVQRNLPTRRPKNRPSTLSTIFDVEGRLSVHAVHPKQSVATFIMHRLPAPGIIENRLPSNTFDYVYELAIATVANPFHHHSYAAKIGARSSFAYGRRNNPYIFGRVLAKIAHAYLTAQGFLEGFAPLLPGVILGQDDKIPYIFGNTLPDEPPDKIPLGMQSFHRLRAGVITTPHRQFRVSYIRLFSFLNTPIYTVIAGEKLLPMHN